MSDNSSFSSDSAVEECEVQERGRKRARKPDSWKRKVALSKRNLGQAYVGATGKSFSARCIGPPCADGCFDKVTRPVIDQVFSDFWAIGSYDDQNAYIQKLVSSVPVKRVRKTKTPDQPGKPRDTMREYTVMHGDKKTRVCRAGFLSIFGLKRKRVDNACRKVTESGTPVRDKRGKHSVPKVRDVHVRRVLEHIRSIPAVASHYTRAKSPHRRYLDSSLSVAKMFRLYLQWMLENYKDEETVKESFYRHIFVTKCNLSFKPPKTDTCNVCDEADAKIAGATDDEVKARLTRERDEHKSVAKEGQNLMRHYADSANSDSETRVICVDLQQTQPLPKLSASVAYYKRKMWFYNLCIHDIKENKSKFFVWDEVTAGRGSVEIVTCLRKWVDEEYEKSDFSRLIVFSDNCGGQNKNINIIVNYLSEVHRGRAFEITHYYLVPGHSYMACDRAFGNIEKAVRQIGDIYDMDTYCNIIKTAVHAGYEVTPVLRHEFLDVGALMPYITHRKPRPPYSFAQARRFVFGVGFKEGYMLGMGYTGPLGTVRLMPGRAQYRPSKFKLSDVDLPQKYPQPPLLKPAKLKDVQDLMVFIPQAASTYLRGVLDEQHALRQDSSSDSQAQQASSGPAVKPDQEDVEEDEPDDFLDYTSTSNSDSD